MGGTRLGYLERETGLAPDEYWVEARSGGAPAYGDPTRAARIAYREGARIFGWAAHGDRCRGYHGATNREMRAKLEKTLRKRKDDFPRARHYALFASGSEVAVSASDSR